MSSVADSGTSRSNIPRMRRFTRDEILTATYSNGLPASHKVVITALALWADPATGAIPPDQRKSIAEISSAASLNPATVCRVIASLESDGWLLRKRPTPAEQRAGGKTGYRLLVPASHQVSLVASRDNPYRTMQQAPPAETQTPRSALSPHATEELSTSTEGEPKAHRSRRAEVKDVADDAASRSSSARIPEDFWPSKVMIALIERRRPDVDWRSETERFKSYWLAKPGKGGEKKDWQGTWRNWMTRARGQRPQAVVRDRHGMTQEDYDMTPPWEGRPRD